VRVVLLGDSHLARVRRDLPRLGPSVVNAAVGGASARDLLPQAVTAGVTSADLLVVSVGSNDAAPWKALPLSEFGSLLDAFLAAVPRSGLVLLTSPGVDESRLLSNRDLDAEVIIRPRSATHDRTNAVLSSYAEAARSRFAAEGAVVVDGRTLLADLGPAAYDSDGLHLTGAAYDVLLPALAAAISRAAVRQARFQPWKPCHAHRSARISPCAG
jgi:lysophospholipase L1-like esterase